MSIFTSDRIRKERTEHLRAVSVACCFGALCGLIAAETLAGFIAVWLTGSALATLALWISGWLV